MVLSVMMLSRGDTLQWLGDDVTAPSGKVADILKLDVSITASPAVSASGSQFVNGEVEAEEQTHPPVAFSDSFSPESGRGVVLSDSEAQRPSVDVDAVTDAVSKLTVMSAAATDASSEPNISLTTVAAAEPAEDDAAAGAVGDRSSETLLSMLAHFADETVRQPTVLQGGPKVTMLVLMYDKPGTALNLRIYINLHALMPTQPCSCSAVYINKC